MHFGNTEKPIASLIFLLPYYFSPFFNEAVLVVSTFSWDRRSAENVKRNEIILHCNVIERSVGVKKEKESSLQLAIFLKSVLFKKFVFNKWDGEGEVDGSG